MGWIHKVVTYTQTPDPTLTLLENNVWMADTVLQALKSKRSLKEDTRIPRDKRSIPSWLIIDLISCFANKQQTKLDSLPVGSSPKRNRCLPHCGHQPTSGNNTHPRAGICDPLRTGSSL
jgi:hypothetical protein